MWSDPGARDLMKDALNIVKSDAACVLAAVNRDGYQVIKYASVDLHKDAWIAAVQKDGNCLQYASEELRKTKEVVLASIGNEPNALKYALGGLNQDPDCLCIINLLDQNEETHSRKEQAILSVKFSLNAEGSNYATEFAQAMRNDGFLKDFKTFDPSTG